MRLGMHIANVTPPRPASRRGYGRAWLFVANFIGIAMMLSAVPIGFVLLMRLLVRL